MRQRRVTHFRTLCFEYIYLCCLLICIAKQARAQSLMIMNCAGEDRERVVSLNCLCLIDCSDRFSFSSFLIRSFLNL